MRNYDKRDDSDEEYTEPSKSELKRQMTALQEIGESLISLSDKQLAKIPVGDERLVLAIQETRRIKSNNARRRHMQFIGRLMRDIDAQPIIDALAALRAQKQDKNDAFHALEELRDEVLEAGLKGVELVMVRWEQADRQQLRQLVLQHQRELKQGKPPAASRKMFKYLRALLEQQEKKN
ncbi:MAG: ribosome biogenesis factor YjgA [Halioglobus sp.]